MKVLWEPQEDAQIIDLKAKGYTYAMMATTVGRSPLAIRDRLHRLGKQPAKGAGMSAAQKSIVMGSIALGNACLGYFAREGRKHGETLAVTMERILGPDVPSCGYGLQTCAVERLAA